MTICFAYQQQHFNFNVCSMQSRVHCQPHGALDGEDGKGAAAKQFYKLQYNAGLGETCCQTKLQDYDLNSYAKQQTEVKNIYIDAFYHPPTPLYQTASLLEYIELKSLLINSVVITVH